jgi:hypothetical protein
MKTMLLVISVIGFLHALRDYLQIRQIHNWFTDTFHFWNAPQYEKYSLPLFLIIGIVFLIWGLSK